MSALEAASLAVLGFWILLALDRGRRWPGNLRLEAAGDGSSAEVPEPVLVVVPARNEAAVIGETLPALLEQAPSIERIVLVDDRSADGTAGLASALAQGSPSGSKLLVVPAEPPPAGWSGKLHALETGLRAAAAVAGPTGWILFTDADIRHHPGSIRALLARASEGGHDLVSVMVRLRADSPWEKLLIPPFVYFFQLLYPFRRVADPRSRVAAAAGGCVLIRREALEKMGGLPAIRGEIIDDVALARSVKRSGRSCWLGLDPAIVSVRGYGTLGEITRMVSRTAFHQLRYRYSLLLGTFLFLGLFFTAPPAMALACWASGHRAGAWAALGAWAIESATLLPAVRHHRVAPAWCLTLPLAAALYAWMTGVSAWRHASGRGVEWKGRRL